MSLSGMSVLLAEDNPTNQLVAVHMLETLGAEVTLANDGAEALEVLDDRLFDVALIDIEMPRVSGLDVIRQLRAHPGPVAAMPMIALTAYVMREHRAAIEDAGADGIIAKPIVSIGKFGSEILAHVRQRRERTPPARQAAPDVPDFDRGIFQALCGSFGPEAQNELVSRISLDIADACEGIAVAVHGRDFDRLARASHPLISVAGMIGAGRLQVLAQRLNSAGHARDDADLDENGSVLLSEAERVLRLVCADREETGR
jgi:CheY-like chemotaxis protein